MSKNKKYQFIGTIGDIRDLIKSLPLAEFEEKYYLHDSGIEKINFDEKTNTLTMTIEFCFWMQTWFNEGELKNGLIEVCFENVASFEYEQHDFKNILENLDTEVIQTEIDEYGTLNIIVREYTSFQPLDMDFWRIKIKADNVEVTELERYNS